MKYTRIDIKTEADLPKKEGLYFAHVIDCTELVNVDYIPNMDGFKKTWTNIDWYLLPDEPAGQDELKNIIDCILKFDKNESLETKGAYFEVIQRDLKSISIKCDHVRIYSEIEGYAYCNKCGNPMQ